MTNNEPNQSATDPTPCHHDASSHDDAACDAAWDGHCKRHLKKERELLLQVQELRNIVAKYATHFDDCTLPCSCGLTEADDRSKATLKPIGEKKTCGTWVGGLGPCVAYVPCAAHPVTEKRVGSSPTERPCCVEAYARGHAVGKAQNCGCMCHAGHCGSCSQ